MPRTTGQVSLGRRVSSIISTDPDINQDRENAVALIKDQGKTPYSATKEDIQWFWDDLDTLTAYNSTETREVDQMAIEYVSVNFTKLDTQYHFAITEWLMNWYRFMPDVLFFKLSNAGQVDWNLFFTMAKPIPGTLCVPFYLMIRKLNIAQLRLVREAIYEEVTEDPELSRKVLNGDVLPALYLQYTPYSKIRKEVIKRLKIKEDYLNGVVRIHRTPHSSIFKRAQKYIKAGLSTQEALEKAGENA